MLGVQGGGKKLVIQVVGIIFLAVEIRKNTQAIQALTRDSITEKQIEYMGRVATSSDLAGAQAGGDSGLAGLDAAERKTIGVPGFEPGISCHEGCASIAKYRIPLD